MLGLARGDAIGSKRSDIPAIGTLQAGAATQLAAWTTEGLLRAATRYGGNVLGNTTGVIQYAYQRWAMLRGGLPSTAGWFPVPEFYGLPVTEFEDLPSRGWLLDVPAMAEQRGSSPSTLKAILSGTATNSYGCQALLRGLPIAAHAGPPEIAPDHLAHYACSIAELTHRHPRGSAAVRLSAVIAVLSLREERSVLAAIRKAMELSSPEEIHTESVSAFQKATSAPCVPQTLKRLAPDKTAASALAGGIYVALSFPEADTVAEALEFAGWAPDGDSVAGAFLGAVHGYEALPTALTSRLELGWVIDQLACDLARQAVENQACAGTKSEDPDPGPPVDPGGAPDTPAHERSSVEFPLRRNERRSGSCRFAAAGHNSLRDRMPPCSMHCRKAGGSPLRRPWTWHWTWRGRSLRARTPRGASPTTAVARATLPDQRSLSSTPTTHLFPVMNKRVLRLLGTWEARDYGIDGQVFRHVRRRRPSHKDPPSSTKQLK